MLDNAPVPGPGHTAVLIIGDFTAQEVTRRAGSTRPYSTRETVAANAKTYTEQAYKILDKERTEIRFNSEWLKPFMGSQSVMGSDFIMTAKNVTMATPLGREISRRAWRKATRSACWRSYTRCFRATIRWP